MPTFAWEARTRTGEVRTGVNEAESESALKTALRQQNLSEIKTKKKSRDSSNTSRWIEVTFLVGMRSLAPMIAWRNFNQKNGAAGLA